MTKCLPEHREIVAIRGKPDDMPDTNPLGVTALKTVRDVK
jgi:hypothetical protein